MKSINKSNHIGLKAFFAAACILPAISLAGFSPPPPEESEEFLAENITQQAINGCHPLKLSQAADFGLANGAIINNHARGRFLNCSFDALGFGEEFRFFPGDEERGVILSLTLNSIGEDMSCTSYLRNANNAAAASETRIIPAGSTGLVEVAKLAYPAADSVPSDFGVYSTCKLPSGGKVINVVSQSYYVRSYLRPGPGDDL